MEVGQLKGKTDAQPPTEATITPCNNPLITQLGRQILLGKPDWWGNRFHRTCKSLDLYGKPILNTINIYEDAPILTTADLLALLKIAAIRGKATAVDLTRLKSQPDYQQLIPPLSHRYKVWILPKKAPKISLQGFYRLELRDKTLIVEGPLLGNLHTLCKEGAGEEPSSSAPAIKGSELLPHCSDIAWIIALLVRDVNKGEAWNVYQLLEAVEVTRYLGLDTAENTLDLHLEAKMSHDDDFGRLMEAFPWLLRLADGGHLPRSRERAVDLFPWFLNTLAEADGEEREWLGLNLVDWAETCKTFIGHSQSWTFDLGSKAFNTLLEARLLPEKVLLKGVTEERREMWQKLQNCPEVKVIEVRDVLPAPYIYERFNKSLKTRDVEIVLKKPGEWWEVILYLHSIYTLNKSELAKWCVALKRGAEGLHGRGSLILRARFDASSFYGDENKRQMRELVSSIPGYLRCSSQAGDLLGWDWVKTLQNKRTFSTSATLPPEGEPPPPPQPPPPSLLETYPAHNPPPEQSLPNLERVLKELLPHNDRAVERLITAIRQWLQGDDGASAPKIVLVRDPGSRSRGRINHNPQNKEIVDAIGRWLRMQPQVITLRPGLSVYYQLNGQAGIPNEGELVRVIKESGFGNPFVMINFDPMYDNQELIGAGWLIFDAWQKRPEAKNMFTILSLNEELYRTLGPQAFTQFTVVHI